MEFIAKIVDLVNTFHLGLRTVGAAPAQVSFFTFRLKFIQVRKFGEGMRSLFGNFSLHGGKSEEGLSSFQALTTAIAAQVGTGNIAGAATAIASGGPGSISGCGSARFSVWLRFMLKQLWLSTPVK